MSASEEQTPNEGGCRPIVSLGMPVYNAGKDLRLAVLSVVEQTFEDWELIVLDDGSSDGAIETIADIDDSRIRVFESEENRGLATRLNEAVELARGEFFARMDQDDICHPDRLEKQVRFLQANDDVDLLGSQCILIDEGNEITGLLPVSARHEDICRSPWLGIPVPHPTWIGKKAWFQRNPYLSPGPYFCEDQELLLRTHGASRFHVFPEPLFAYRVRSEVNASKLRKTQLTLMRIQWRYFLATGKYHYALLSVFACFGKIAGIILPAGARSRGVKVSNSPGWAEEWEQIFKRLKCSAQD